MHIPVTGISLQKYLVEHIEWVVVVYSFSELSLQTCLPTHVCYMLCRTVKDYIYNITAGSYNELHTQFSKLYSVLQHNTQDTGVQ